MVTIMKIDYLACRESSLHGLGHWWHKYPARVATIIDNFLTENPMLSSELGDYAHAARVGKIR
jgi:hypothetical protein